MLRGHFFILIRHRGHVARQPCGGDAGVGHGRKHRLGGKPAGAGRGTEAWDCGK